MTTDQMPRIKQLTERVRELESLHYGPKPDSEYLSAQASFDRGYAAGLEDAKAAPMSPEAIYARAYAEQQTAELRKALRQLLIAEKLDDDDPQLVVARQRAEAALRV